MLHISSPVGVPTSTALVQTPIGGNQINSLVQAELWLQLNRSTTRLPRPLPCLDSHSHKDNLRPSMIFEQTEKNTHNSISPKRTLTSLRGGIGAHTFRKMSHIYSIGAPK